MDEVLHKLIEFVESASPVVWAAAQQQVRGNIIETGVWLGIATILFLVCLATSVYCVHRARHQGRYEDWWAGVGLTVTGTVLLLLFSGGLLGEFLKMLNNPLWYAIKILGELVP